MTKKIIVAGAGFGGVFTCLNLIKKAKKYNLKIDINLIDKNNYFLFTPLLHEVASGNLSRDLVITPIRNLFYNKDIKFFQSKIEKIDFEKQTIHSTDFNLIYDYLVLATGAKSPHFSDNTNFTLKTLEDAERIKYALIDKFENLNNKPLEPNANTFTLSIIGAGPTGVELACELAEFRDTLCKYYSTINKSSIKINLISANEKILEIFTTKTQKYTKKYLNKLEVNTIYNKYVTSNDEKYLYFTDGNKISSDFNYWTTGIIPNLEYAPTIIGESGKIHVNQYLETKYKNVYGVGDIIQGYPSDAQSAVREANIVANNIITSILNKSDFKEFIYKPQGKLVSLGRKNAAGEIYGIQIHGRIAWFIWRTIYLVKMITCKKTATLAVNWTINLFTDRDIAKL